MRSYEVLVHSGRSRSPDLHLVTVADDEAASELADQLLFDSITAVGVEVNCAGQRLYARGTVPVRFGEARSGDAGRAGKRPQESSARLRASA